MDYYVLGIARQVVIMMIAISMILLFVGIGTLIVIHVCIVGRAYRRGIGTTNMVERGSLASNSMSHEDIEKLPSYAFQSKNKGTSPIECAVCLDNLKVGEKCRLLPLCSHSFHAECIDLWLLKTSICPICRATAGGSISGGESSRYSESGRQELNGETAELAETIFAPESDNPINSSSFETIANHTGRTAQNSEQLSGIGSIDGQITSEVYVNISETSNDLREIQEVVHASTENSTELRATQPIETIHLVHEETLQSREPQTAQLNLADQS
ncbi:RING-H2 finger protein ATL3-like [Lycium ferocissimum]|uniref:RING-H2 finger protein ATL3-like n=1 Tax=Lycium ferocissimum TaxID=112874 RepID=UPI0028151BBD|nr:RING-H2 finger protein ATL3-like [Lycium ferocissimum]